MLIEIATHTNPQYLLQCDRHSSLGVCPKRTPHFTNTKDLFSYAAKLGWTGSATIHFCPRHNARNYLRHPPNPNPKPTT